MPAPTAATHRTAMPAAGIVTVRVDCNPRGDWDVVFPGRSGAVTCETLDEARRIAYLCAARRHRCELIVRDACHRALEHDLVDGVGSPAFVAPRAAADGSRSSAWACQGRAAYSKGD